MSERPDSAELRAVLENLIAERKELRAENRNLELHFALEDAGFDPASPEAKAISQLYPEDAAATPDDVTRFAADEYGFTPTPSEESVEAWLHAERDWKNELRLAGEDRTAMLNQGSLSPRDPLSLQDKVRVAEAKGDWAEVNRLNAQMLQNMRK